MPFPAARANSLIGQVDLDGAALSGDGLGIELDRQDAVADAIIAKYRSERRRDDGPETIFGKRPHRMFSAGTATEIGAGEQDSRVAIARIVENELGIEVAAANGDRKSTRLNHSH